MDQGDGSSLGDLDFDLATLVLAVRWHEPAGQEEFRRLITPLIRIVLNRAKRSELAASSLTPEFLCEEMIRQLAATSPDKRVETLRWIFKTVSHS